MTHNHPGPGDEAYRGFRITSLWAWTVIDDDDQEGIPALSTPDGPMPLIASDRVRLDDLRPWVQGIANEIGKEIRLRRFVQSSGVQIGPLSDVVDVVRPV